jgi:hypothetical protein
VADEFVEFLEGALIEEKFDPFARGELAFGVLAFAAFEPAPGLGTRVAAAEFFDGVH